MGLVSGIDAQDHCLFMATDSTDQLNVNAFYLLEYIDPICCCMWPREQDGVLIRPLGRTARLG